MGCCGRNRSVKVPTPQQSLVNQIQTNLVRNSSATKSNRSPAGTIAKECQTCKTKSVLNFCPICGFKF